MGIGDNQVDVGEVGSSSRKNNGGSRSGVNAISKRVAVMPLLDRKDYVTRGAGATVVLIVMPMTLRGFGPQLAGITIHARTENTTTNFKWEWRAQWSFDGESWVDFSGNLIGTQTGDGQVVSAEYTTHTDFGLYIRFVLGLQDSGAVEAGTVSAVAALRFQE